MPDQPRSSSRIWRVAALPGLELMRVEFSERGFPLECHEECSIGITVQGAERLRVGSTATLVGQGDISLVNSGEIHGSELVGDRLVYRGFMPSVGSLDLACRELGRPVAPFFRSPAVRDPALQRQLLELHMGLEAPMSGLEASSRWLLSLGHLLRRHGGQAPARPAGHERAPVARAREIIEAGLAEELTLSAIAARVGLTAYALAQAFRRRYGMAPHAYQTMRRVAAARALLRQNIAPAQVAATVGFFDQSHLNRHFKRYTGVTDRSVPPGDGAQ